VHGPQNITNKQKNEYRSSILSRNKAEWFGSLLSFNLDCNFNTIFINVNLMSVVNACVKSVLLYGCETRLVTNEIQRKIQTFVNRCLIYEGWNFNSGNYLFTTDTK